MEPTIDIKDGSAARYTSERGWEFERIVMVYNVTGTGQEKFVNAKTMPGVPAMYSVHPAEPIANLKSMEFSQIDTDTVRIVLSYRQNSYVDYTSNEPAIEIGSSVSQVETNTDKLGEAITLSYAYPSTYTKRTDYAGQTHEQGGMVSKLTPQQTYTVTKREGSSVDADKIEEWNRTYVGKINSNTWRTYYAPRTWLCTGISGSSSDGGDHYIVRYSFQYNPATWAANVVFIDPNDGKPPDDLVFNTGKKVVQVYDEVSFAGIDLE